MPELNIERITKGKTDILSAKAEAANIVALDKDMFFADKKNALSLKYLLIQSVEAISDICQHTLAKNKGVSCNGYVDCIVKAGENGIITHPLANKLRKLADLRNSLIHRYWIINDEELYKISKENIGDLDEFVAQIDKLVVEIAGGIK